MSIFDSQSFTITRPGSASVYDPDSGLMIKPDLTTTSATGNVQPLSGKELDRLPEGLKLRESILIISTNQMNPDDIITYAGKTYKVTPLENWTGHLSIGRYEAVAVREPYQGID